MELSKCPFLTEVNETNVYYHCYQYCWLCVPSVGMHIVYGWV